MILISCDECGTMMPVRDALISGYSASHVEDGIVKHVCKDCLVPVEEKPKGYE